jgi:anaerobic selenocysteine-containing dehydrogenase
VVIDPLQTETARFFENHGEFNQAEPANIQTEVFELPSTCFAEDEGALVNSSRWLQWHWPGQEPPFEAKTDIDIMAEIHLRLKAMYKAEGGAFPDPILNLTWPYRQPAKPTPEELAKELNGYTIEDVMDPADPSKVLIPAGRQLDSFAQLTDDGKTAPGAGSIPAPLPRPATRWRVAIRWIRPMRGSRRAGPGPGQPTAVSSTTALRPTCRASPGRRISRWCGGTARAGSASTCRTS